jgi:transcription elongation factor GreA
MKQEERQLLLVSRESYDVRAQQLKNIMEDELPACSREISASLTKGDLRENAEYAAAIEKQRLLQEQQEQLRADLERAQMIDPDRVETDKVSVGTRVKVRNIESGEEEQYTVLGAWDSDSEKGVISYLSPLGKALLGRRPGDIAEFSIGETSRRYSILSVEAAAL